MVRFPLEYNIILNSSRWNTFGWTRKYKDGSPKFHKGWDLQQPRGTAVYPASTGEIVGVQHNDVGDYGRTINLKFKYNGNTYYAFYAHLDSVWVNQGDEITSTSMQIGAVGDSGNALGIAESAMHLHFEFRNRKLGGNGTSDRIDPVVFLGDPPYDGLFFIDDE
jgi:murein DD-endopeptidase MepM/ murein hydrolase activator NlpD